MPYARDGLVIGTLLMCVAALVGCGPAHCGQLSPVDFAFTGFAGVSIDLAGTDPVGYAEQLMYCSQEYRDARRIMDAKGLETFSGMVMLEAGGCERGEFIWAFKRNGAVSCLTSLPVQELGVPATGREDCGEGIASQATFADGEYERAVGDLCQQARKGAYSVGATGEYNHDVRLHVVAYDRDRNFFLRATTVDKYVMGAIWQIIDLEAFEPGMGKQEVLDRWEKTFAALRPMDSGSDDGPGFTSRKEYENDHKRFVKIIAENWDKCLPFLVAAHLVWPEGRPLPKF